MKPLLALLCLLVVTGGARAADALVHREWTVDGVTREALVYVPSDAAKKPTPLVFAFHGHNMQAEVMAKGLRMHELWPAAIVVYPQGLKSPGPFADKEGKFVGWQFEAGQQNDRDLKFFDALLATMRGEYRIDDKRICVTGHSNGSGLVFLLWATHPDLFAAAAPIVTVMPREVNGRLKPLPMVQVLAEKDLGMSFKAQWDTLTTVLNLNLCGDGEPWGEHTRRYKSKIGATVVTYTCPDGKFFPDAAPLIARFFKDQVKR